MRKVLIIDLHCDALLPAGLGEFGGGNTYSKSVISTIINTDIEYLYVTRKKIHYLPSEEKIAPNLTYIRIKIGQDEIEDKDTLYKYSNEILDIITALLDKYNFVPHLIHSIYWPSGIIAEKLSARFHVPFIHTILSNGRRKLIQSGNYEISDIRIQHEESCFKNAKYIICSSAYELDDIKNLYSIPPEKLILTGLQVDSAFINPTYDRAGKYKLNTVLSEKNCYISIDTATHANPSFWWNNGAFLYYGRLHPDKGIIQIIDSWLSLKQEHFNLPALWIAGGSPEQIHHIRELISNQESLEHFEETQDIIWWGRLSAEGISTLMLKTLVLISHSRYESGGLMILEAMAHAIPVIATPFGYANDYVQNGRNGFIVPFNDINLLKRRMLHFYYQPFLAAIMGQQAQRQYKKVSSEFDFANKHLELYKSGNIISQSTSSGDTLKPEGLPYPLAEYIPSNSEVLSIFLQYIKNTTWDYESIPILKKSEAHFNYHIWIIEYNAQEYHCFRWKTFVNINRMFNKKEPFFYTCQELTETDKLLYSLNACQSPINISLKYDISIYQLSNTEKSFLEIKESFKNLFTTTVEKKSLLSVIDFYKMVHETKNMLHDYDYCIEDISADIYNILLTACLEDEPQGLVPKFLTNYSFANNQCTHIGCICVGTKSYFYALYLLTNELTSSKDILQFLNENAIESKLRRNIIYWILNLRFCQAAQDVIYNNNSSITTAHFHELLTLLEQNN